jgi:hypothetical protein
MMKPQADTIPIPTLAKVWLYLYHAAPKVKFPGSNIDWGFTLVCLSLFCTVRLLLLQLLYSFGWPVGTFVTMDAAGCLVGGIFHTSNLVPLAFVLMRSVPAYDPAAAAGDHPQWWQDVCDANIQLCTGHMLCDTLVGFLLDRNVPGQGIVMNDEAWLFLAHHIISLLYLVSTRVIGAGQQSMLMCFLLGEITDPPFSAYLVAQSAKTLDCCSGPFAMRVIAVVEVLNALVYIPFRAVVGPIVGAHMTYLIFCSKSAQTNLPVIIRMLWTAILWGIAIGSVPYVFKFVDDLNRHLGDPAGVVEAKEL